MSHRAHLFSVRLAHAFREACLKEAYSRQRLLRDVLAGVTVGIIAIPLAMALAIASGVPPQHGLYTAMIAGFVIALTGGSRLSVSGPTAAFVVILYPVAQQYGLGGLLIATLLSGLILVGMALARLGRLIEYIPDPVTLGFTSGIAIVIATLQIKDLFGLPIAAMPESYLDKLVALLHALPDFDLGNLLVAGITLLVLLLWPKLKLSVPGHLPAVLAGVLVSLCLGWLDHPVDTIASRFSYVLADASQGQGIPPVFPEWIWPWQQPGADGLPLVWTLTTVEALLKAAFSMAMLGAIESLLCAVILDGMTGRRHSANSELLGQGLGNMLVPFFGGITATAAIARSTVNYRAGAESPVAAMIHALVVMAGLLALAPLLGYLPMASMAALLVVVAWNMSEAHKVVDLLRKAPAGDVLVLLVCLSLTVLFDMVIAISTGIVLASLLFMRDISGMTRLVALEAGARHPSAALLAGLPGGWAVFRVNGPLFFAAADRIFSELALLVPMQRGVILSLEAVPILDAGGLAALTRFLDVCRKAQCPVIITDTPFQPLKTLARAKMQPVPGELVFFPTLAEAVTSLATRDEV